MAVTLYIATNGVDGPSRGLDPSLPLASISYLETRMAAGGQGSVGLFLAGTYDDVFGGNLTGTAWTSGNYYRFANYAGGTVWIRPSFGDYIVSYVSAQAYIEFDGINLDATHAGNNYGAPVTIEEWSGGRAHHIRMKNAEIILGNDGIPNQGTNGGPIGIICKSLVAGEIGSNEFLNLTMHGGGDAGDFAYCFYLQSPDNVVDGCVMYDNSGAAIHIYNSDYITGGIPERNIVKNCIIHSQSRSPDTRIWGVIVGLGNNSEIYNNVFYDFGGSGDSAPIYIYNGTGNLIYNNTINNSSAYGIRIDANGFQTVVRNNIVYATVGGISDSGSSSTINTNLTTDPLFVNASIKDFRIQSGSDAEDAGATIALVTTDILGVVRPQGANYDIGAYELSAGGGSAVTVTFGDNATDTFSGSIDAHISNAIPTTNEGTSGNLNIYKYSAGEHYSALVKFTGLSNIPSGATITAASLHLYNSSGSADETTHTFTAYRLLQAFTEAGVTWNVRDGSNAWATMGALNATDRSSTASATAPVANTAAYKDFTGAQLIADIQGFVDGTYTNNGWIIERTDGADDFNYRQLNSSENTDSSRPYLSVTYEPAVGGGASVIPIFISQARRRRT